MARKFICATLVGATFPPQAWHSVAHLCWMLVLVWQPTVKHTARRCTWPITSPLPQIDMLTWSCDPAEPWT